jgi:hypothetical protein
LSIDWKALGINPAAATILAPEVRDFQPAAVFNPDDPIPVQKGKGWLLIIQPQQIDQVLAGACLHEARLQQREGMR